MWIESTETQKKILKLLDAPQLDEDVRVQVEGEGIRLERIAEGWNLFVEKESMLGRAVTLLCENKDKAPGFCLSEKPLYDHLGVMLDCSRNAVPTLSNMKKILCILSKMGYNTVQLYMEDVYELEAYPYFGYGRGRYTKQQLKEMDAFAADLGIELIPSIQTLAHLAQTLKWKAMRHLVDVGDILLMDDPKTDALLRDMFAAMRECFSAKRINIGMDEAHMLGLGKYLDQHGYQDRTQLMLNHFKKVHDIALEFGFEPMMWSDMFFRLASGGDYYALDTQINPEIAKTIPKDTTLVYWDYYSEQVETYDRMLERHTKLCPNVVFAGGAWKWSGFAPCNRFSMKLADMAHGACCRHGVKEVLLTMWGDNGTECSPFAALPALQYWAELCWTNRAEQAQLERRFQIACGGALADFMLPEEMIFTPDNPAPGRCAVNASKTMLYEDILFPLFSPGMDLAEYETHMEDCCAQLEKAVKNETQWSELFATYAALAKVILQKVKIQLALRPAWKEKDKAVLSRICEKDLPELEEVLNEFIAAYHRQWLMENKPQGLDAFDLRVGGLGQRIRTAKERLEAYLAGSIDTVEELDDSWLPFDEPEWEKGHKDPPAPFWHEIASPCSVAMI